MKSRFGYRTRVPSISSQKGQTKSLSFKDGVNTFKDNDDVKPTEAVMAQDARFSKIGRYETRRGADRYSVPVGEAVNVQVTSTTGAANQTVGGTSAIAQKLTVASSGRITRADVRLRTTDTSRGVLLVEIYDDDSGAPGELIARSSVLPANVGDTYDYESVYFIQAPLVSTSDVVWCVVKPQNEDVGSYNLSSTTASTDALTSIDSGTVWTAALFSINVKLYTSTDTPVKGVFRAYRPNGTKVTLFAYGNTVASVNDTNGAVTVLKSDFTPGSTHYRFRMVQDAVYVSTGVEKTWKYDFATSTWTQMTAWLYTNALIEEHKGMMIYDNVSDRTQVGFTNFAEVDVQTSTDFLYAPAPKSADSITAFAKLNGVFYIFASRNKFQLLGADRDQFVLDEALSQRGTFSQESVVYDANYIYHADEDGIWQYNGTSEKNLAEPFLSDYQAIPEKSTIQLDVHDNRLYCFYAPDGSADNTECFVMNLQLDVFESVDLGTYIGRTFARGAQDNLFIQASNRVAALYYGELPSNDNHNLGDQLQFEVRTAYQHFDTPGQYKRAPKARPQFESQTGDYSIQVGYDLDNAEDPTDVDVSVSGDGPRLNTGVLLDSGARLASAQTISPTDLFIPGDWRRAQRRYKHHAAREPVELDSEVLTIEVQRIL